MEALLIFNHPYNTSLLDEVMSVCQNPSNPESRSAQELVIRLEMDSNSWTVADEIVDRCQLPSSRFLGIQILEGLVKRKWRVATQQQRDHIKEFVYSKIMQMAQPETIVPDDRLILNKLDLVLVQVLKQEWPHNWQNFIPDLIEFSKTKETICENNLHILTLLSEEVFEYSTDEMQSYRINNLKEAFRSQFESVFSFCKLIVENSQKPSLISSAFRTLMRFLVWVPPRFVFESGLVDILLGFFHYSEFRNDCLECFIDISSMPVPESLESIPLQMFKAVMENLYGIIAPDLNLREIFETMSDEDISFIRMLALFFSAFFKEHLLKVEQSPELGRDLQFALNYMVSISCIREEEIFKISVDFWKLIAETCYFSSSPKTSIIHVDSIEVSKYTFYEMVFVKVRDIIINNMARPEEVLIDEDHNGQLIHVKANDTENIALYKSMKECLVYLTHQNSDNIKLIIDSIMKSLMNTQLIWSKLNSLCWSLGSITGTLPEDDEKTLIIKVVKDLLALVERAGSRDDKAVIASGIMYVVGQYPRFLKLNWKFFKTVTLKLHDFMREDHPGVKDMATDTFRTIVVKCSREFVTAHPEEPDIFARELILKLDHTISLLEQHQIYSYIGSVGLILKQITELKVKQELILLTLRNSNLVYKDIMMKGKLDQSVFTNSEVLQKLHSIYRMNAALCEYVGSDFLVQFEMLFSESIRLYMLFAEPLQLQFMNYGPGGLDHLIPRQIRALRRDLLMLYINFCKSVQAPRLQSLLHPLNEIIEDYTRSSGQLKEPLVMELYTILIKRGGNLLIPFVPAINEGLIISTLPLIKTNFEDNPEHRLNVYKLLNQLVSSLFKESVLESSHESSLVEIVLWGIQHVERTISEISLEILEKLIDSVMSFPNFIDSFWGHYFVKIIREVVVVLTDGVHKNAFHSHSIILKKLLSVILSGRIQIRLSSGGANDASNADIVLSSLVALLGDAFPNAGRASIFSFITQLSQKCSQANEDFSNTLRDFLISLTEFSSQSDNTELFSFEANEMRRQKEEREKQIKKLVPGLQEEPKNDIGDL